MSVKQLEAVAHFILALCERAKSDDPESIDDDTILEVLNDFSHEDITPEARHGWKDAIVAVANLSKLFNSTATCPTATAPTTTPAATTSKITPASNVSTATVSTAVTTTAPTATTSTTTPTSNVSTATVSTAVASTTTTAKTAPTEEKQMIAVSKEISENLETWKHSPEKLFHQDSIPLQGSLCNYINKVSNSDILNTLRLRFAKRMLSQKRNLWPRKATKRFFQHLKDRGAVIEEKSFKKWLHEGDTYGSFVKNWGNGALLATDLTATKAARFPSTERESHQSRLDAEKSRGIQDLAKKYNDTGTALWSYFSQIPFTDNFVSANTTSPKTNGKRKSSQTLPHQDRRPFRIDKTPAEFAQQPELVSSPATTQLGHVAEREAASTDGITTRDAGGGEGSRLEVENLQRSSPTAPARYQPVAEPSLRSASSSPDWSFTGDDCQRPLNRGTDMSTYSGHGNDRLVVRPSPRTHQRVFGGNGHSRHLSPSPSHSQQLPVEMSDDSMRNASLISGTDVATSQVFSPSHDHQLFQGPRHVPQHPQVPGDVSSHSPTTHPVPTTIAIQSRIAEPPSSNPRSGSQSHVPIQEPSASPQHDRRSELSPTHQPKLPSPEPSEKAKTNDDGLGSAQQPLTQILSPVQPHGLEPISGATETSCYPQHGNPPPHPPQTVSDQTVTQRHGTGGAYLEFQERNSPEFLESQDSLPGQRASTVGSPPPVHQQTYQPKHPEVTGYLDQLVDLNEPRVTPAMLDQPHDVNQEPGQADVDWNTLTWDFITSLEDVSTGHLLFSSFNELEGIL